MVEATILRSEAMREADSGDPFDMSFVTCDRKRGTGGELVEVRQWVKMSNEKEAGKLTAGGRRKALNMVRHPNHWENKTVNIYNPNNRATHPIKVHYRLIQFFNGKRVTNG